MDMGRPETLKMQASTSRPGILWLVLAIFGMPEHSRTMFIEMLGAVAMLPMPGPVQNCPCKIKIQHCPLHPLTESYAGVLLGLLPSSQSKTFATLPARSPAKSILSCTSPVPFPFLPSPPLLSPHAPLIPYSHRLAAMAVWNERQS